MIDKNVIDYATDGTAWKTDRMNGYVKKTVLDAETYGDGAYKLTFVNASGTNYDFYFNVDSTASATAAAATDANNLTLTGELLGHILESSWNSGRASDYEDARDGGGSW